jgi:SAM-dependent methyltransferase
MEDKVKVFYNQQFLREDLPHPDSPEKHRSYREMKAFLEKYDLKHKRCLEIGCGFGAFQDLVDDYTGVDIVAAVGLRLHKPFYQGSATELPFPDNEFDVIWTFDVLEHVPFPEKALSEMRRVLRHNGLLLLKPAWFCRPWAAEGYPVRPYSDFGLLGKLVKFSIKIRDHVLFRSLYIFPKRVWRLLYSSFTKKPLKFKFKELKPNLEIFWMADSDAINSMDPFEAILWFKSRGDACLTYPEGISQFFVRTGPLIFKINKCS